MRPTTTHRDDDAAASGGVVDSRSGASIERPSDDDLLSAKHGSFKANRHAAEPRRQGATVTLGSLDIGFIVDDGPRICPEDTELGHESGSIIGTTNGGFGLGYVHRTASARGWHPYRWR